MTTSHPENTGHRLSLIIPAWNEGETIRQAVQEARTALAATTVAYEIIVVDDGSTDETADLVRQAAAADPRVRLVQHPKNLGYGAALRSGFQAATLDLVAFTDADCQFDLNQLAYVLPLSDHYDIACGCRIDRKDPARRRFLSWGYNTLAKALLGCPVHDIDCALKVYHRDQLAAILPECNNFLVNTEMLTKARLRGMSVVEVGVHHRPRLAGESKVSLRDVPRTLSGLLPFWWSQVLFPGQNQAAKRMDMGSALGALALLITAVLLLFSNLSYPLIDPDEGRYAEIGREMLTSGDWVVPTLHGRPYLDKPPMFYWLLAGSFRAFGLSEQSARLVPVLAALLTVAATFWFGRRMVGTRGALLGGFALTLMAGFLHGGRFIILDSVLTLFVSVALFAAYEAIRGERLRWPWWLVSAACCALGVLTKGPVALVLTMPPVAGYAWLSRNRVRPTLGQWAAYGAVALGLAAPWYVAISVRQPGFAYDFVVEHHLKRFFTEEYHDSPTWFYLPVLFVGCMPWSLLIFPFTRFLFTRSESVRALRCREMGLVLLWAGWCVLFFSLSRGKLPPYVLPALPAIALLNGCYLERLLVPGSLAAVWKTAYASVPRWTVVLLSGTWLVFQAIAQLSGVADPTESHLQVLMAAVGLTAFIGAAFWGHRWSVRAAWTACVAVGVGLVVYTTQDFVPDWSYQRSLMNQPQEIVELLKDHDTAVACCEGSSSVSFFLNRGNARNFDPLSLQELREFLRGHARTLLIVPDYVDLPTLQFVVVPSGATIVREIQGRHARFILVSGCPN